MTTAHGVAYLIDVNVQIVKGDLIRTSQLQMTIMLCNVCGCELEMTMMLGI